MAHRILSLSVRDDGVHWSLEVMKPDGRYHRVAGDQGHPLPFDENGQAEETVRPLVDMQRWLGDLLAEQNLSADKTSELVHRLSGLVKVLGQHLYTVLFKEPIHDCLLRCLNEMANTELLRIELEFTGKLEEQLLSWPWEYLYIPLMEGRAQTGRFLAPLAKLVLTRRLFLKDDPQPLLTPRPVRVLFVRAAPHDLGRVACDPVLEAIRKLKADGDIELIELIEPDKPDLLSPDWQPTATVKAFEELITRKDRPPHIIHFVGHGRIKNGRGELAFVGADGKANWIDHFAGLARKSDQLKLVFLQACESALADPHTPVSGVAHSCAHEMVPAVIAMQAKVQNEAANQFARTFYEVLAQEKSVDYAVKEAREALTNALRKNEPLAFGVPVLYLRSYDSLFGPKPTADNRPKVGQEQRSCPRCNAVIRRDDQKFCTNCELAFYCVCKFKLDDPNGNICGECGRELVKKPWPRVAPPPAAATLGDPVAGAGPAPLAPPLCAGPTATGAGNRVRDFLSGSAN